MSESRTKNSKRNIIMSYINMFVTMLFQFFSRAIIVHVLGNEYLGLSNLFTSILQVLSLADLGFANAITYNLYKPLAENDNDKVCALLEYFKKVYRVVGAVIFGIGLALMPFIHIFIRGDIPKDINLYVLYVLYLINTSVSYFLFAYKNTLMDALQRNDIVKNIHTIVSLVQYVFQIAALVMFKNFYLFVVINVIGTMAINIVGELVSKRFYPQYFCNGRIDGETKKDIIMRVKGLLICKISGQTYTTLDSIVISSFIGLSAVAIYNNYLIIFTGVTACITAVRMGMQASVGNKVAVESVEKNYQDVFLWQFLFSALATICVTCMLCLYQPFMMFWMGKDSLLSIVDVVIICLWFDVSTVSNAFFLYLTGNGIWFELKWAYILSTVFNLTFNIVLGKYFGITGILVSSLLSSVVFGFIWQSKVIIRISFHENPYLYWKKQIFYFLITCCCGLIAYYLCSLVNAEGIWSIICNGIISVGVSVFVMVVCYFRLQEFKDSRRLLKNVLHS